jgi:hypothetical protein
MNAHGLDTSFLVAHEISRHASHRRVRSHCDQLLARGDRLVLAPQVLAEFIHVVTDNRRFAAPLSIGAAVERASIWWHAEEVFPIYPQKQRGFSWIGCFSYVLVASAYSTRCWRQLGLKRECHKFLLSIGSTSRCTVVSLRGFRSDGVME